MGPKRARSVALDASAEKNRKPMQIKLFTMPVFGGEQVEEELNKFLRSHRVLQLERHFGRSGDSELFQEKINPLILPVA